MQNGLLFDKNKLKLRQIVKTLFWSLLLTWLLYSPCTVEVA